VHAAQAQQQQGRVVYELTRQLKIDIAGPDGMEQHVPRSFVVKVEVLFGNNQMLRRRLEDDNIDGFNQEEGGMHFRAMGADDNDITWCNFTEGRMVEQREFATKQFLVTDSVHRQDWKLTGETKTILGYACQQALTTRVGKRKMMNMENGNTIVKEIADTSQVIAWFTPAIPVPAGPDFQGQLPGLILEIDINGTPTYKAVEVSPKVDIAAIKEPKGGKKVTVEDLEKKREKLMQEMQRNRPTRMGFGG
jgi:GLPGLI family protein